ncbi:hypothetical protein F5Y01DRAFT_315461 [Xylaria sp. FL0043]|nr:hypothetical protein F5Y01DRAFT_315461 [Xylaria sp. FL0043]
MPLKTDHISGALAIWLCNGLVASLILARLGLRRWHRFAFTVGDYWLVVALVFTALRVVGDYYMNKYGTPLSMSVHDITVPVILGKPRPLHLTPQEQDSLVLASKLMIATRIAVIMMYVCHSPIEVEYPVPEGPHIRDETVQYLINRLDRLWSMKMSVLDILSGLLRQFKCRPLVLWFMSSVLAVTFFASILSIFLECQELELNWVLFPNAHKCSFNSVWIITYEINNIMADIMLFFLPVFLMLLVPIEWPSLPNYGLGVVLLFGLGVTLIVVEIVRLIEGLQFTNMLLNRIVWGSVETAIAASIATLPTICILLVLGFQQRREKCRDSTHEGPRGLPAVPNPTAERAHNQSFSPQQIDTLHENHIHSNTKPMLSNSAQSSILGSILGSVLPGISRNRWTKSDSTLQGPFRGSGIGSGIGSRISSRMRGARNSLSDSLTGWIELEGAGTETASEQASSPEPDDLEYRGEEIFTATEIKQGAHQDWGTDQRPRIVAIPRRAKISHPIV